jgi:hypothetical protein
VYWNEQALVSPLLTIPKVAVGLVLVQFGKVKKHCCALAAPEVAPPCALGARLAPAARGPPPADAADAADAAPPVIRDAMNKAATAMTAIARARVARHLNRKIGILLARHLSFSHSA